MAEGKEEEPSFSRRRKRKPRNCKANKRKILKFNSSPEPAYVDLHSNECMGKCHYRSQPLELTLKQVQPDSSTTWISQAIDQSLQDCQSTQRVDTLRSACRHHGQSVKEKPIRITKKEIHTTQSAKDKQVSSAGNITPIKTKDKYDNDISLGESISDIDFRPQVVSVSTPTMSQVLHFEREPNSHFLFDGHSPVDILNHTILAQDTV